ncbi:MAG: carboxy terminal-processing peptidase [Verrucomicrobiales bacterium]
MLQKRPVTTLFVGLCVLAVLVIPARCSSELGRTANSVVEQLSSKHFSRHDLREELPKRVFQDYLAHLDYNRTFFTQQDIEELSAVGSTLYQDLYRRQVEGVWAIHARYMQRLNERVSEMEGLLADPNLIDPTRSAALRRNEGPWPADLNEAKEVWRDRIAADLLQEQINRERNPSAIEDRTPEELIQQRYERMLKTAGDLTQDEIVYNFLKVVAFAYDPHSDFLTPSDLESFRINMRLSVFGIGALLRWKDGFAIIQELIPGGPAILDGRLQVKDRVAGVAQGDQPFVDTVDMPLDKVVDLIRGPKGSKVRLLVVQATGSEAGSQIEIELVRNEVQLKDQAASAELIEHVGEDGKVRRLGWLTLPNFYADMQQPRSLFGGNQGKSTTRDVATLVRRLMEEGIDGLCIDLSTNGGGSLEEAINMTGLFIPRGPVVQAKDSDGMFTDSISYRPEPLYQGPLIVLTSRYSASASEIFAGALQDYGRAIVVGDRATFGKGTVQTIIELPHAADPLSTGALRYTIQKFYRISGGSTQFKGVVSDIVLPSVTDVEEIGESSLTHALPYDVAPAMRYSQVADLTNTIQELRNIAYDRIANDPEFTYMQEDRAVNAQILARTHISLDKAARLQELQDRETREELRKAARADKPAPPHQVYHVTLDNAEGGALELAKASTNPDAPETDGDPDDEQNEEFPRSRGGQRAADDPIKLETLRVMRDWIELSRPASTAGTPTSGRASGD